MSLLSTRGVVVNRLRIHSRMDPLTARTRAGWLLDESALQPSGLPPSAILCIRRLSDPQPGSIALDGSRLPPRKWTDLVAASIADLARRAAHPGRGDVPDDVDAVMFADRAELLACLAADWCAGRLASRWWSRELLKGLSGEGAILRAWLDSAEHIAGAFELLAERRIAGTFVRRLSRADTRTLLDAIVFHHGLRWIAPAIEPLTRVTDGRSVTGDAAERGLERESDGRPDASSPPPWPPWIEYTQDSLVALPRADQQCLLGIALTLRRAPAAVRALRFAERVHRWCAAIAHAQANDDARSGATVESLTRAKLTAAAAVADVDTDRRRQDVSVDQGGSRSWSRSGTAPDDPVPINGDRTLQSESSVHVSKAADTNAPPAERNALFRSRAEGGAADSIGLYASNEPDEGPAAPPTHTRPANASAPDQTVDARAIRPNPARAVQRGCPTSVETQLGGVFYLLNLATSLGLYGDFTTPIQPCLDVSIWDFLALAAQRLTPNQRFRNDGLWNLLADLAGRPRGESPATIDDLRPRAAPSIRSLTASLRARLARSRPRIAWRHAGTIACVHRATVLTSATHVDVMFALAELPVAIRLSGLDRDPGWVPDADRVVAFHYD